MSWNFHFEIPIQTRMGTKSFANARSSLFLSAKVYFPAGFLFVPVAVTGTGRIHANPGTRLRRIRA
jgi:hypothetical protein